MLSVNLRLLSLTLVVVLVGALVASAYADGLRVPRVLAECHGEPVEEVTSDCGPGCRDDGGGAGDCQSDEDCQRLYGGDSRCICDKQCVEFDNDLLTICVFACTAAYGINCEIDPVGCAACEAACVAYCYISACRQWVYVCGCASGLPIPGPRSSPAPPADIGAGE